MEDSRPVTALLAWVILLAQPPCVKADTGDLLAFFIGSSVFLIASCAFIGYWSRIHYNLHSAGAPEAAHPL
eukprot:1394419-Amorphochlora_amoeboformis.AAC.1